MEEAQKLKIVYGKDEYEIGQQELDRLIAIASKKLRNELISAKLGMGIFPIRDLASFEKENSNIRVFVDGFESEFYKEMNETLLYAIEEDMLENFRISKAEDLGSNIQSERIILPLNEIKPIEKFLPYKSLVFSPAQLFATRLKQYSNQV